MSGSVTFFGRLGKFFRRSDPTNGDSENGNSIEQTGKPSVVVETRPTVLRSWGRNNAAIAQLQEGFSLLTELMGSIRQNMESQGHRQDELIAQVSALPKVLESLPESIRMQGETVKAIHQQLVSQGEQQAMLGEILQKLADSHGDQKDLTECLRVRVETLNEQDKAMADSLHTVGSALESVSKNSSASTQVLCNIRDNLSSRDADLDQVLRRQATRFTAMLATAVGLSMAAMIAVVVMGYLTIHAGK
jgi:small-conductance mechanosensitive channel